MKKRSLLDGDNIFRRRLSLLRDKRLGTQSPFRRVTEGKYYWCPHQWDGRGYTITGVMAALRWRITGVFRIHADEWGGSNSGPARKNCGSWTGGFT